MKRKSFKNHEVLAEEIKMKMAEVRHRGITLEKTFEYLNEIGHVPPRGRQHTMMTVRHATSVKDDAYQIGFLEALDEIIVLHAMKGRTRKEDKLLAIA